VPGTGSDDWTRASDHGPFHEAGIPFLYFGVEDHEDYHRATDEFDRIDPDFFVSAVETVAAVLRAVDRQ
jgi:Zn-dependent M28 family amino/carboxypeptidase